MLFILTGFLIIIPTVEASHIVIPIPEGDHNPGLRNAIDWYVPRNHAVNVGDIVTWENQDFIPHTVTSGTGISLAKNLEGESQGVPDGIFDSGIINPQDSWSFTFTKPGTFTYFCTLHPWIQRSITVLDSPTDIPSPKKQMKEGVEPFNVQCRPNFELVFKVWDLTPACFKSQNVQRIINSGWASSYDPYPLRVVQDGSERKLYVTLQGEDKVGELYSNLKWNTGPKMTYLDASKDGSLLLATSSEGDMIHAIDLESGNPLSTIKVGKTPKGVKIHQGGEIAFVANENSGTISVIDLTNWEISKEIPVGDIPHNIVFHPNARTAYVTIQGGDEVAIIDIESLEKIGSIPVGKLPHNLDITPDGSQIWVTNIGTSDVAVIDLESKQVIKRIPVSKGHHGIDIPPFGDRIFVSGMGDDKVNVIDATSQEVIQQIIVGQGPHGLRTDSLGDKLYVGISQTNEIKVIDTETLQIIETLSLGEMPFWIASPGNP